MKTDSFSYEQFDQLTTALATPAVPQQKKTSNWLAQVSKLLSKALFQQEYEPKVWERVGNQDEHYWEVYDPITAQRRYLASELEVRIWLDKGAGYRY